MPKIDLRGMTDRDVRAIPQNIMGGIQVAWIADLAEELAAEAGIVADASYGRSRIEASFGTDEGTLDVTLRGRGFGYEDLEYWLADGDVVDFEAPSSGRIDRLTVTGADGKVDVRDMKLSVAPISDLVLDAAIMGDFVAGTEFANVVFDLGYTIRGRNKADDLTGTAFGGNDRFVLRGGDDRADMGDGRDKAFGGRGRDEIAGGAGGDRLWGGAGRDVLEGNAGHDRLWGGKGADSLFGNSGHDLLVGGLGNDDLTGGNGRDTLRGGRGEDDLSGGRGADRLSGNRGSDELDGDSGADRLWGGKGHDTLSGGSGRDTLIGGKGRDVLTGGTGADVFVFGRGHGQDRVTDFAMGRDRLDFGERAVSVGQDAAGDVLLSHAGGTVVLEGIGAAGFDLARALDPTLPAPSPQSEVRTDPPVSDDALTGSGAGAGAAADVPGSTSGAVGGSEPDTGGIVRPAPDDERPVIEGHGGPEDILGTDGAEIVFGGGGADVIDGAGGNDALYGDAGDDVLRGGAGRDELFGGAGADALHGGAGDDDLTGGAGADVFHFARGGGVDTVTDFESGVDRIVLPEGPVISYADRPDGRYEWYFDGELAVRILGGFDPETDIA